MNEADKKRIGEGLADLVNFVDKYDGMPGILENVEQNNAD